MATPVTVTLVFQGLIAFLPGTTAAGNPDLTAYLIDSSPTRIRAKCLMIHNPTIRFVTASCDQGCKLIKKCPGGPAVDTCECALNHDVITVGPGPTAGDVTPKKISNRPPHQMPFDGEGSAPEYVVNMYNLGARLDSAQLDPTKVAATMEFAYGTLETHNFAHVQGFAKRFTFKQINTIGMTSHRQAAATLLLAKTVVADSPVTLTLKAGASERKFKLTGTEILIQNEQNPNELPQTPPCDLNDCSRDEIGFDFIAYYSLAQGGLQSAQLNLPHGDANEKHMKICDTPFHPYTSDLEDPPHYVDQCKCADGQTRSGANAATGSSDPCVVAKDITSRPICPMAAFVQ